jgi:hypothetical protein
LIAAISREDSRHFSTKYGKTIYLPAFHSNEHPEYNQLSGDYILYHGNLAVSENYEAAMELIQEVFSRLEFPCIIAGNNPPRELQRLVERFDHIRLITKTTTEELHELIAVARINVLHTNQDTGIKLKLINALYRGKHVVANRVMVANTGLESLCIVGEDLNQIRLACKEYYHQPFERESYKERIKTLNEEFENKKSALKILDHIPSEISESLKKGHGKIKRTTLFSSLRSFFLP